MSAKSDHNPRYGCLLSLCYGEMRLSEVSAGPDSLHTWIQQLLTTPVAELNARYPDRWAAYPEVEPLLRRRLPTMPPLEQRIRYPGWNPIGLVPDMVLQTLHTYLYQQPAEAAIWGAVIPVLTHPLPEAIGHDLLDREIALDELEHSRQVDSVQWRLAERGAEALLTVALERYLFAEWSVADFEQVLAAYPTNFWMLDTLLRRRASSAEKEAACWRVVVQHPDAARFARFRDLSGQIKQAHQADLDPAEWQRLFALREPEVWRALAANPISTPEQLQDLFATQDPLAWEGLGDNPTTPTALLEALYTTRDPHAWRGLAANPHTPEAWLYAFLAVKQLPLAHQIRMTAKASLQRRRKATAAEEGR
jgi:hypothetical protein